MSDAAATFDTAFEMPRPVTIDKVLASEWFDALRSGRLPIMHPVVFAERNSVTLYTAAMLMLSLVLALILA